MDPYAPTDADLPVPTDTPGVVHEVRRIDPFSVAKLTSVLYGGLGLLFGGMYGIVMILMGVGGAVAGEPEALVAAVGGVAMILIIPIFYGVLGGVMAGLMALLYNVGATALGGIRFELRPID